MANRDSAGGSDVDCSRRRWLQTAAVASTVGLAGCSLGGSDPEGQSGDTTESEPNVVEGTFQVPWLRASSKLPSAELNRWGANFAGVIARHAYMLPGARSQTHDLEWYPLGVEDWTYDEANDELRVRIRDDVYWTQGGETIDPVTAEDVSIMYQLLRYMTPASERSSDPAVVGWRVEGDDDKVLVQELNPDGYNLENVLAQVTTQYVTTYRNGFFGEKLAELKAASDTEAKTAVREEIAGKKVNLSQDPPLNGPYMLETVNQQTARFELNPDHWTAKAGPASPRTFEIKILGGGSNAGYQALQSGDIDLSNGSVPSSVPTSGIPDTVQQVSYASNAGTTLIMNYGAKIDPYMGVDGSKPVEERVAGPQQAKIRQGIAHAISFDDVLANHLGTRAASLVDPYQRAHPSTPTRMQDRFPDLYETLPSYTAADQEAAAQRFEEAGLSQNGSGTWVKPDGSPLTITLQASSASVAMLTTIREDLESVGLSAELETLGSQIWNQYLEGTIGAARGWVQGQFPLGIEARQKLVPDAGWPPTVKPGKYEVPPVGEMDADPTETVNVIEATEGFAAENFDAHRDATRKLVWTYAYHLPDVPIMPFMGGYMVNTETMSWPEPAPDGTVVSPTSDHNVLYGTGFHVLASSPPGVQIPEDG